MTTKHQVKLAVLLAAAMLLETACILPGEPSGAGRVTFVLDFEQPYRVPMGGSIQPPIAIAADGHVLQNATHRLESLDPSLVRVDPAGRGLEGVTRGSDSVRVVYETATGAPDTVFAVQVVASRVVVDSPSLAFTGLGAGTRLRAAAYDANDVAIPDVEFRWSSANPGVAMVNDSGLVTAVDEGTTTIAAEADGVADSSDVMVTQVAAVVQIISRDLDTVRTVGRSLQFFAVAVDSSGNLIPSSRPRWTSTDTLVARVNGSGLTTATGGGTARIVARVGAAADTAVFVVAQVVRFFLVTPDFDTLTAIADTARLKAVAADSSGAPITNPGVVWATSDPAVATVDQAGLVQAAKNGYVLITATAGGYSGFATVVVRQEVATLRLAADSLLLTAEGDTVRLSAVVLDRTGHPVDGAPVAWRSLVPLVATVDSAGVVTARGGGRAEVVVRSGARADTAIVTVTGVPAPRELIAFVSRSPDSAYSNIYVMNPDGSDVTRLTAEPVSDRSPAWSPDGTRIAFVRDYAIYEMNADGSGVVRTGALCLYPARSPDGTKCAVGGWDGVYVMNLDGSGITKLTDGWNGWTGAPAWSPDGRRIAFEVTPNSNEDEALQQVYVMNADGSDVHRLTSPCGPLPPGSSCTQSAEGSPAWSPDGSQIAFASWAYGLVIISSDGSGVWRSVYTEPCGPTRPHCFSVGGEDPHSSMSVHTGSAWSPDGTALVFNRYPNTESSPPTEIWLVNVDGSGPRMLRSDSCCAAWRRVPRE